jgi:hypothetical protein
MLPILLAARWQPSLLMFDYALGDKMACIIHCKARASLAGIRQLAALFLHSARLLSQKMWARIILYLTKNPCPHA